jgi:hypothetical protein
MRRTSVTTVLITVLVALAFPASALAVGRLQWTLTPKNLGQPNGATPYTLGNDTGGTLRYGNRLFGVDLVWGGGALQWELRHNTPTNVRDHRVIPATETVALYNRATRRYLASGFQRFGVDLVWVTTPRYQWRVYEGQDVNGNVRVKLYNTVRSAYLIYGSQTVGINLTFSPGAYTTPPPNQPSP